MKMLLEACAEDLQAHNPPLSNRFLTEWEITVDEYELLCDRLYIFTIGSIHAAENMQAELQAA